MSEHSTTDDFDDLQWIDEVCQQFEDNWKQGNQPNIENVLENVSSPRRRPLFKELLALDIHYRQRAGTVPHKNEYSQRFSEFTVLVDQLFHKEQHPETVGLVDDTDGDDDDLSRQSAGRRFSDYELLEEIDRGGMGVVYKARHLGLKRMVALKMIRSGQLAGPEEVERFKGEAERAAQLDHANIVPIFEVGCHKGHHFFTMGLVEGESLAARIAEGPLPPREAADLCQKVSDAVEYAHQREIIHRDLKPANILLDRNGEPKVTDYGLSKKVGDADGPTVTEQVLGTPAYMPPEQAASRQDAIDERSDIYSLGATLYALLTGTPPFRAASIAATLRQVIEDDPVPPRQLNRDVDVDLETITLKCLEKHPDRRYLSAQELSNELGRYLRHEPVHARPIGPMRRSWKWCQRNALLTALATTSFMFVVIVAVVGIVGYLNTSNALSDAVAAEQVALEAAAAERRQKYIADMKRAEYFWEVNDIATARGILDKHVPNKGQADLRGFEWRFWRRETSREVRVFEFSRNVQEVAVSPDGEFFAAAEQGGTITLQRLTADEPQRRFALKNEDCVALDFSQDGSLLAAAGGQGLVRIWDVISGDMVDEDGFPTESLSRGYSAFDAGCDRYAWSFGGTVGIRDRHAVSGEKGRSIRIPNAISGLKLNGGEKTHIRAMPSDIASIGKIKMASWAPTSEAKPGSRMLGGPIYCLDFCFTQDLLAVAGYGGVTKILSLNDGRSKQVISGHDGLVFAAKFSPDGRQIATGGSDGVIRIWDVETGAKRADLVGHTSDIYDLAFVAKGRLLASGGSDRTVRLWDTTSGKSHAVLKGHEGSVESLCVFDDGKMIASAGDDQTVRVWAIPSLKQNVLFRRDAATTLGAAFAPDSKHLGWIVRSESRSPRLPAGMVANVSYSDQLCLWNWQDEREVISKKLGLRQNYEPDLVAFAGDASRVAVSSIEYHLKWEGDRPNRFPSLQRSFSYMSRTRATGTAGSLGPAMYLPDGKLVFPGVSDGKFLVRRSGTDWKAFETDLDFCLFTALSPDGKTMAVASDYAVQLWDLAARKQRMRLDGHTNFVRCVAFSRDGKTLASASSDGSVKLWDVRAGKLKSTLRGHDGGVSWVAISPDSRTIASAGRDGTIRLWDLQSGEEKTTLRGHAGWVTSVAFSPDGRTLASTGEDGTVRLWRSVTNKLTNP